ncbi:MAG: hypothetical protein GX045_05360 [Clostridiaceae bacterium]|nr:hypothetical protein [Clostridiaceae bacterium]
MKKSGKLTVVVCLAIMAAVCLCYYLVFIKDGKDTKVSFVTPTSGTELQSGAESQEAETGGSENNDDSTVGVKAPPTYEFVPETTSNEGIKETVNEETDEIVNKETEKTVSEEDDLNGDIKTTPAPDGKTQDSAGLIRISRDEAGLDTIPSVDFGGFSLNKRIHQLLIEKQPYTDDDMKAGIVAPYLITERFREPVIDDISIGTSIKDVMAVLGAASYIKENIIIYKTYDYYKAFWGDESVELVNFAPKPKDNYDVDMLNEILTGLCLEDEYLMALLYTDSSLDSFFERKGFVHGGGNYAISDNGVEVNTLFNTIEIYNNFEGNLYQTIKDTEYKIEYKNADYVMEDMMWEFANYFYTNESFLEKGKLSPSGKYMAKYDYIYSQSHYFTIRTMDHSKPDYYINAVADEFEWINDDYIIYTDTFSSLLIVIRITRDNVEHICLSSGLNDLEYDYGFGNYDFSIKEITEDRIILEDKNADESKGERVLWEIPYIIDENGEFILPDETD